MLFVSEIQPINRYQRKAIICDTALDFMGEITFGEDVSDDYIRRTAPFLIGRVTKPTIQRRKQK